MSDRRINRPNNLGSLSKNTLDQLSDIRKAEIVSEANKQIEKEEEPRFYATVAHSPAFKKRASAGPVTLPGSSYSVERLGPEVYSPLFQLANLNLPRDRVTMNAWNRIFYDTNPIVRNAINLHASYPISKINITCKNKKIQQFFLELAEKIDLYSAVYGVATEYYKLGEVFPYAELDPTSGSWKRITVLNPDYIYVQKSVIGDQVEISLRPDAGLQKLVNSNNPRDIAIKRRIPQHIIQYVKKGMNIPLNNMYVSHLKLLSSPYDIRGTSIIVSIYKDLMQYDKLKECKFAQADGMINPLTHVKLGGDEGYKPTPADLESIKNILEEAQYDKDFKLITHDGVKIERVGYSGQVIDIGPDIEAINNNIYVGLMVPKAIIEQESTTYASSSVGLEVLRQRYDIFRNMIKKWLEQKIFAPICELQEFIEYVDGEQRLIVPTVDFNHMNLWDMNDYITNISNFVGNKAVSMQTLHRTLGLSYEEEIARLKEEAINDAIRAKEQEILGKMRLAELRNLDSDSIISEINTEGEEVGQPQEEMPQLPGLDLGGEGGAPPGLGAPPPPPGGGPPPPEPPPTPGPPPPKPPG